MAAERLDISSYGEKQHLQYIKGIQGSDPRQIQESAWVSQRATTPTAKPYVPTEFDQRFSLSRPLPFAHFFPPTKGMDREGLFFRQAILPSDFYEQRDALLDKLARFEETLGTLPASTSDEFTKIKEGIEAKDKLTRMFELIKARLNQFQRG